MGKFQQPKGTTHTPTTRLTLSGKPLPARKPRASGWEEIVAPGPEVTGVKRPFDSGAPVLTPVLLTDVVHDTSGVRRRDRRAAARASA